MLDRVAPREKEEREYVRKWKPDDLCDLDRNESWFSDMAEQGLFVDRFTRWSVWFKRGTPQKARYRMDVLSRELTEDELLLYDSCGWHFAALAQETHCYYYVFQTDENAGVPELHTDPMEQAESLKKLRRGMWGDFWFGLAATAVLIWVAVRENGRPDLRFNRLVNGDPNRFCGSLFYLLSFLNLLRGWLNVRRLHRRLAGGEPLDHHADYRKAHWRYAFAAGLNLLLVVWLFAMLAVQVVQVTQDHAYPLPKEADFPAVRLEEVYGGALSERGVFGEIYHEWTITGAVIDDIRESAFDAEANSILELNTVCYRLPFAWTAERAFDALTKEEWHYGLSEVHRLGNIAPVDTELVDEAWAAAPGEDNWNHFALLVRDGRYLVLTFYLDRTNGDFDDPLEAEAFRDRCAERLLPLLTERLKG